MRLLPPGGSVVRRKGVRFVQKKRFHRCFVLLAILLLHLPGCGSAREGEPDVTPEPAAAVTPSPVPAGPGDTEPVPKKKGKTVRVAVALEMPSAAAAGFRPGDDSPEAAAYREEIAAEQQRVIDAVREITGSEPDVVQRLWKNVNLISLNVPETDIPRIAEIDGVARVSVEKVSQLMTAAPGAAQ